MLGDCLECMKEIPDGSVDMVLTDPPYGTTACKWDSVIPFEPMWVQLKRIVKPNGAIVLMASQPFTSALVMSNVKMFKYEFTWVRAHKSGHLNAKNRPMVAHENVLVFYAKQPTYDPVLMQGSASAGKTATPTKTEVYGAVESQELYKRPDYVSKDSALTGFAVTDRGLHPTQKPVSLMEYLIKTYTNEGETVLDFTMGSGTTGVAAANTGRRFIGVELDQKYFEIAVNRMSKILPL